MTSALQGARTPPGGKTKKSPEQVNLSGNSPLMLEEKQKEEKDHV